MTRVLADEQAFQFNSNPSVNPGNYNALYTSPCSPPAPCFSADHGLRSAVFTPLGLQSSTNLSGGDILAANAFGSVANQHVSTPPLQCMDHVDISPPIVATPQICSAHCVLDDKGSDLMRRNITKIIGDGAGEYANQAYLSDLQESEWKVDGLRTNMLCRSVPKVGLMAGYGNLEAILGGLRAPSGESENKDEMGSSFLCTDQGMLNVPQLHTDHGGLQAYLEAGNILCGSSLSSKVAPMGGKADLGASVGDFQASVGGLAPSESVQGGGDVDLLADDWRAYLGNRQAASHVGGYLQASLQYSQALQEGEDHGGISRSDASQIERDEGDLQAAAYLGDLQASIVAEARFLQRFLPSNEEEEGEEEELGQQQLLGGALFGCDEFRMYEFKVSQCMRERNHDWTQCPFAHPGEKARRRDPRLHQYSAAPCPDFRKATCKRGDACELSHGVFECWLHPSRYRTQLCKDGKLCKRKVCFFAHSPSQLRIAPPPTNANSSRPSTTTHLQQRPTTTAGHLYDGSPLRLAMAASQLIHGLPRHCSHSPASSLNHHVGAAPMFSPCHRPTGTAASSPFSYDHGSPLRMAMASSIHGLPATNDGNLEGFSLTNNHCLVGCPQSLNSSPLFSYDGSRLAPASDHGGFPCCKAPPTPNSAVFNGFGSMHSHSYGVSPSPPLNSSRHLSSDGSPRRLALAAPIDGFPRCNSYLNGGAFDGFIPINKFALCSLSNITHHIALPNSGLQLHSHSPAPPSLPLSPSESPPISPTTLSNWNNAPLAHRLSSLSGQAPSLDAVSQAQAILAAHALAQYQAVHGPSTPPVSPNARHHVDILNSMQGAVPALNTELINDQNPQNVIRGLHSPQAMANLIASLQQMELRCLAADEKNKMKFVHQSGNVPCTPSARVTQAEPWDGNGIGGSPLQRAELGGNLKARIGQEGPSEIKANLDLGWVNELVKSKDSGDYCST